MNYVCSDIHGQYDYFLDILEKINFSDEDHMYILGDVVDRGPDSIKLLQFIFDNDNMTLLIGNHEHLMIQSILYDDYEQYNIWMNNKGETTLEQFEELKENEQKNILIDLFQSPLVIPNLKIYDKNYYLTHASHLLRKIDEPLLYCNANRDEIETAVWSRDYQNIDTNMLSGRFANLYSEHKNTTMIIGHSPVFTCSYRRLTSSGRPLISRACSGHLINIDCGCARGLPLGCLRLEDMKEFYADIPKGMKIIMKPKRL